MQHLDRYVSCFSILLVVACLFIPASAGSVSFGYQPDPVQFSETGNSYILNNSELEIEFFKDTLGYNQYRNARNGSVLIYDARTWVDYLGPGDKWKPAGIAQTTSYRQIYKGYEVTRHYTGIQADYDIVYIWVENKACKHTIYIIGKVEDDFQISESYDGVVGTSKIEKKSVYAGDDYNLIISIQDVIRSFGNDSVVVTETTSAHGKKFDYTFGSWGLNFSDMVNGSHQIMVDPSVTFNGSNSWADTSGTMIIMGNNSLRNDDEVDDYIIQYDFTEGTGTLGYNLNRTPDKSLDWTMVGTPTWESGGGLNFTSNYSEYIHFSQNATWTIPTSNYTFYWDITPRATHQGAYGGLIMYAMGRQTTASRIMIQNAGGILHGMGNLPVLVSTNTIPDNTRQGVLNFYNGSTHQTENSSSIIFSNDTTLLKTTGAADTRLFVGHTTNFGYNGIGYNFKYWKRTLLPSERQSVLDKEYKISNYREIDNAQDAGANQVWKYWHVEGTDPSANTSLAIQGNVSNDNSSFSWVWINNSCNVDDNVTASLANEYRYLGSPAAKFWSNTTWQPETNIISNITITSALGLLPPQNLTNITEQTQICFNWDDDISADKWNISQRIPSIPYTDVIIVLDGVKDSEFTDRAHTWVLDSPNPTGSNGDKELISWIRNTTTLSGYADGEDNDALNNDDSFTIMLDMTANNLTTDDRQFILSESGTVTAKRWGGAAWLPQATNAAGVVIGAGVIGDIQYEMQIPISELTNFNNGSTIKLAMARKDTSQNPDVTKYYPKTLINDTDATIWTSINLSAECEFTFLGNTTLSNYTVTGLVPSTWYRHRFSTINGSTESSYVYSNDVTEDSPQYTVSGYILTESGSPISEATVWSVCDCGCVCEVNISNATGYYQGDCFYNGTYTISASKTDYDTNSTSIVVNGANQSNINITLSLSPVNGWTSIVDSVAWGISVAQYLVSNIGIVITTAFSLICILILAMLIGAALSVTNIIFR